MADVQVAKADTKAQAQIRQDVIAEVRKLDGGPLAPGLEYTAVKPVLQIAGAEAPHVRILCRTKRLIQFIADPLINAPRDDHHVALSEYPAQWAALSDEQKQAAITVAATVHDMTPEIIAKVVDYLEAA